MYLYLIFLNRNELLKLFVQVQNISSNFYLFKNSVCTGFPEFLCPYLDVRLLRTGGHGPSHAEIPMVEEISH